MLFQTVQLVTSYMVENRRVFSMILCGTNPFREGKVTLTSCRKLLRSITSAGWGAECPLKLARPTAFRCEVSTPGFPKEVSTLGMWPFSTSTGKADESSFWIKTKSDATSFSSLGERICKLTITNNGNDN